MISQAGFVAVILAFVGLLASDPAQDLAEYTEPLLGIATCLPYVGGDAKAPTTDRCTGLGQVLQKSFKCICVLVKDQNDPSAGFKFNTTLALGLPSACHTPVNISWCINLLRLDPNSPDAKMFSGFEKSLEHSNRTKAPAPVPATGVPRQAQQAGDGSIAKPLPGALMDVVLGAVVWTAIGSCIWPSN